MSYWKLGATLTQTLLHAPSFSYWRAALASIGAQRATWDVARRDAAFNVRTSYFTARANAALVDIHLAQVDVLRRGRHAPAA